jgi:hypothetical protein
MEKACETATNGLKLLENLDSTRISWKSFNYFPAGYCSMLLGNVIKIPVKETILGCEENQEDYLTQCLDACILMMIRQQNTPKSWHMLFTQFSNKPRYKLLFNNFQTYSDIIFISQQDPVKTLELVEKSASLYLSRKDDNYFSGGLGSSGGGLYNPDVVDYRLGAIIKYCTSVKMDELSSTAEVHYWRW